MRWPATLILAYSPIRAQDPQESASLATFVALTQYIRSDPAPSDVRVANLPSLATLDAVLSDIYITEFITPYTGETPAQVTARLQAVPKENRFIAAMVESHRLAPNHSRLDAIQDLLAQYYVDYFTASDLAGAPDFLKRAEIARLAAAFDSTNYAIPAPSGPAADRAALVALYNATDGPNWPDNANWLTNNPLAEWRGVTTNDEGRVTRLDLGLQLVERPNPAPTRLC